MLTFAKKYSYDAFSQGGEDGIIAECIKRIWPQGIKGRCAEFGAHDGKFCSNTRLLLTQGWHGIMIEADEQLFKLCMTNVFGLHCDVYNEMITPENANQTIPKSLNVLSIDCDGPDYGIWKAYVGQPDIVIIEINSSIEPTEDGPVNDPQDGTAYKPMCELAWQKGYFVLCHTGNIIAIRADHNLLFPEITSDPITQHELFFNRKWID